MCAKAVAQRVRRGGRTVVQRILPDYADEAAGVLGTGRYKRILLVLARTKLVRTDHTA